MFKTFNLGLLLGLIGAGALLYYTPVVDLYREPSLITVQANGGNSETFHVNLPGDRLLVGMQGGATNVPPGLEWPQDSIFDGLQVELFKIRDGNDVTVGVGSRLASRSDPTGAFVQWVLHLPARGTMYVALDPQAGAHGRDGVLKGGTRDFAPLSGSVTERFVAASADSELESEGRIELVTRLIAPLDDEE